jgi:hypothetical protein
MQKTVVCHLMQQLQVRSLEIVKRKGEKKKTNFLHERFIFKTEIRAFCYGKITIKIRLVNFSKTDYSLDISKAHLHDLSFFNNK